MSIPTEKLDEFRAALDASAKPLFFFDGDADGLTSYVLLYKYKKEGRGVMISGRPQLNEDFVRKYEEFMPDTVFILDTAQVTQEFIDNVRCPIYWLDHHDPHHPELKLPKRVKYYNPRLWNDEDGRPTSYWAYLVAKQNLWIAMAGVVSDYHFDEAMAKDFCTYYPEYLDENVKHQGEALFNSRLGELIRVINFNLKGSVSTCLTSVKILTRINHPDEIMLQTSPKGKYLWKRYTKVMTHYERLYKDTMKSKQDDNFIIFTYSDDMYSLSGDLANEIKYKNPDKGVIVGRVNDGRIMMSLRSENYEVLPALQFALEGLDGYGGGHPKACGGVVAEKDFDEFITKFKEKFLEQKN